MSGDIFHHGLGKLTPQGRCAVGLDTNRVGLWWSKPGLWLVVRTRDGVGVDERSRWWSRSRLEGSVWTELDGRFALPGIGSGCVGWWELVV